MREAQPPRTKVPPELIDTIIDFCHSDPRTLARCALVAKAWVPSSRSHLFESTRLRYANFERFLALCRSANCSFLPYIRDVTMLGRGWKSIRSSIASLDVLEALDALHLLDIGWFLSSGSSLCFLPRLKTLDISECQFEWFIDLTQFIASFPTIERLRVYNSRWRSPLVQSSRSVPFTLHSVEIWTSNGQDVLDWLVHSAAMVKTFSTHVGPAGFIGTTKFLQYLGPSLENFELTQLAEIQMIRRQVSAGRPILDLSQNTRLVSLHLHLYHGRPLDWFPLLIAQIQSPQFTNLILTIHGDTEVALPHLCDIIRHIDLALHERPLATVRHVLVLFSGKSATLDQLNMVKGCLPFCTERGLLRFSRHQ